MLQSLTNAVYTIVAYSCLLLVPPTVLLLWLRKYAPAVGNPLWDKYVHLLGRLFTAPIRVIQVLVQEAMGRRRQ